MKKVFTIIILLSTLVSFGQSKKEQIITLNNRVDSFKLALSSEKESKLIGEKRDSLKISSLDSQYKESKSVNDNLSQEKYSLQEKYDELLLNLDSVISISTDTISKMQEKIEKLKLQIEDNNIKASDLRFNLTEGNQSQRVWDITSNSIGDISYDMTIEEIEKIYGKERAIRSIDDDSKNIELYLLDEQGRLEMKITSYNSKKINNILVLSHIFRLQNGIGLGSTKGDLDAHFGLRNLMFYGEGADIVFSSDELGYIFTFHGRKEWIDDYKGYLNPNLMDEKTPFNTFEILIY
jgi:hypothetical protein|tara:strand:- start:278 stop:1156 length:879 start_codon:yes stop_codon:yes gene_type:complete